MAASKKKTKSQLTEDLYLFTTQTENPLAFSYEVECTALKAVTVTLNFTGSENFAVENAGGMKVTISIRPFYRVSACKVLQINKAKPSSLKMTTQWTFSEPSAAETAAFVQSNAAKMKNTLKTAQDIPFPAPDLDPADEQVHATCQNYGKKFLDKDFPPTVASLYKPETQFTAGEIDGTTVTKRSTIEWKRARDFMTGEYHVFESGIEPADIRQGCLGDCWFLCAIAALTEFPQLVEDLVETKQVNEHGVYRVRFCKNGWWQSVRVDDYFPCYPGAGPIYSRSNGNELWVMLLEKAFAKLCGSYEGVRSGQAYEAMMDMTGAPCKTVLFDDAAGKAKIESGQLWRDLLFYDNENYIMSASSRGEDTITETGGRPGKDSLGLVWGHAYTLISAKQTTKGDRLVKLRNPWGDTEWTGDWSDTSPLWTEQMQMEIERVVKRDDGMFWMSFEDLTKYFRAINVCMVRHKAYHPVPWVEHRSRFHYEYNTAEGTPDAHRVTVPMYKLTVPTEAEFIFEVHQEDVRCAGAKEYIDVGVSVLKANDTPGTYTLMAGTGITVERQCGTELTKLPAGTYLVVPTTTGTKLKESMLKERAAGLAPAATTATTNAAAKKAAVSPAKAASAATAPEAGFTDAVIEAYSELFDRLDLDNDGVLDKGDIDQYMLHTKGTPLPEATFQWLLSEFEGKEAAGLSKRGFLRAQEAVLLHTGKVLDKKHSEFHIPKEVASAKFESGRAAVLSIHGTEEFSLDTSMFDPVAYEEAMELPAKKGGTVYNYASGKIGLYIHYCSYYGVSVLVENKHTKALSFELDCSASKNLVSHRGSLKHKQTIPPGEAKIMHHLLPAGGGSWQPDYQTSYTWD